MQKPNQCDLCSPATGPCLLYDLVTVLFYVINVPDYSLWSRFNRLLRLYLGTIGPIRLVP